MEKMLIQLHDYLDIEGIKKGYLLIFNFNKNKIYNKLIYEVKEKEIFEVNV